MIKTLYLGVDKALLSEYIRRSGLKLGFIVEKLGISRYGFSKKINGKISFKATEVYTLCDLLNIPKADKEKIFCSKG